MQITCVGVDLAKNVFQVHGVDRGGRCVWRRQLRRSQLLAVLSEKLERSCEIGMEACGGAHHWARELRERGFEVKLIAPQFVKPYVKSQKNDARDAEAICEAMSRPAMRFVAIKETEQQDIQVLHRVRSSLITQRTAQANQLRGLVARFGDGGQFRRGRQAAASVGLTPRHHGTGGKNRIFGITKRGDSYLRSILVHGARSAVSTAHRREDRLSCWVSELKGRTHTNVAAVALANKTVRIAWAMLNNGTEYKPEFAAA